MRKRFVALLAGAMMMLATSAMATPISGTISFQGAVQFTGAGAPGTISAANATGVKFLRAVGAPTSLSTLGAYEIVNSVTGDYAALPDPTVTDTFAFFNSFQFAPILLPNPVTTWSITNAGVTYDFVMNSVTSEVNGTQLLLTGTGMLGITGYDDTAGNWTFSSDGIGSRLSFSAASAVPEPGTMMLLGMGMLGMAVYGKRRMNKEA